MVSNETRKKMSNIHRERYSSEEARKLHSERMKKWWADRKAPK